MPNLPHTTDTTDTADPTRELARFLGFWDEGLGQYRTEREETHVDDCD